MHKFLQDEIFADFADWKPCSKIGKGLCNDQNGGLKNAFTCFFHGFLPETEKDYSNKRLKLGRIKRRILENKNRENCKNRLST